MAALGQGTNHLGSWPDDAENPSLRIQLRDVSLLDRAQSLSRCRIATQDYQMATHGKSFSTAWRVNLYTTSKEREPYGARALSPRYI